MAIAIKRNSVKKDLKIPEENYVYFHHTGTRIVIPVDPETLSDQMSANFASNYPLSRSAPIYSYQNSGPRSVQVSFRLHRDLCNEYNNLGYDAVDALITNLDQMVLPDYNSVGRIVNPPVVSLKIRDEVFIKGIVTSTSHTFEVPIIQYGEKNKYALVSLQFSVNEVTPYSASIIANIGQYRDGAGFTTTPSTSGIVSGAQNAIITGASISKAISGSIKSVATTESVTTRVTQQARQIAENTVSNALSIFGV